MRSKCGEKDSMPPKIRIASKKFQIKVVRNWILYKKVRKRICLSSPGVELGGLKDSHLWKLYIIIFQRWESFTPTSSTMGGWGEIDTCARGLFCTKFNFEQLLFKALFDAMRIFGSIEAQTESTSPFLYIIIFQRWVSVGPPSSTLRGDRHKNLQTSLYEIQFRITFI